jgi:hypothetical protein
MFLYIYITCCVGYMEDCMCVKEKKRMCKSAVCVRPERAVGGLEVKEKKRENREKKLDVVCAGREGKLMCTCAVRFGQPEMRVGVDGTKVCMCMDMSGSECVNGGEIFVKVGVCFF